jgi:hypothetical protein
MSQKRRTVPTRARGEGVMLECLRTRSTDSCDTKAIEHLAAALPKPANMGLYGNGTKPQHQASGDLSGVHAPDLPPDVQRGISTDSRWRSRVE